MLWFILAQFSSALKQFLELSQVTQALLFRAKLWINLLFLFVTETKLPYFSYRREDSKTLLRFVNCLKTFVKTKFTWWWATPGRWGKPFRWDKKIVLVTTPAAIPGCTFFATCQCCGFLLSVLMMQSLCQRQLARIWCSTNLTPGWGVTPLEATAWQFVLAERENWCSIPGNATRQVFHYV